MAELEQHQTKLQWVLVDGEPRHVSDFAHLPPRSRPQAICPICSGPVILKLGNVRVHHCAHPPNVECAANQPETIIHLNTKMYLYHQLQQASDITITERCNDGAGIAYRVQTFLSKEETQQVSNLSCQRKRSYSWLRDWDSVEVEYRIGNRRPDIALLSNGKVIGAIEVLVSHAVDNEKALYLKEQNIPWIEIKGQESFYMGDNPWTPNQLLPVHRMQPDDWVCENCHEIRKIEERYRTTHLQVYAAKIVDFYYASGKKYRVAYVVMEIVKDGVCIEMSLQDDEDNIMAHQYVPITQESIKRLTRAFEIDVENRKRANTIVDSPMHWDRTYLPQHYHNNRLLYTDFYYPRRYAWWREGMKWFLPKDRRNISWDKTTP